MQQPDELVFEALPQRIDANKNKRRRKDTPAAAAVGAAAPDVAGSSPGAAAAAAADSSTAAAKAAEAVAAATAAAGSLNAGFGFHNMEQQQPGSHDQQEPEHIEDPQQYRSAAIGHHKFEYLDHTADVQLHAWGSSLQEALEQVGLALFNYMTPIDGLVMNDTCTREVTASGHDLHSLLFAYLDELLFIYATEYIMFAAIDITHLDLEAFSITATGRGEKFDRSRHECGTEVKAITYSAMQVRQSQGDAEVFVIVDI